MIRTAVTSAVVVVQTIVIIALALMDRAEVPSGPTPSSQQFNECIAGWNKTIDALNLNTARLNAITGAR